MKMGCSGTEYDKSLKRMPYVLTRGVPKTGLKLARVLNTDPSSTEYQIPDNPLYEANEPSFHIQNESDGVST